MGENKSSNNRILLFVLLALLLALGAYTFKSNAKHKEAEEFLKEEKNQILTNLNDMETKFDDAIAKNTSLSDELKLEKEKIIAFRDSVKDLKNANWRLIRRYRSKIAALEKTNERLMNVNDSLQLVTNTLTIEKDSITGELITQRSQNDTLMAQNSDLAKKVEIGGALRVSSVNAVAMRLRSNGKYKETNKAQKATAIRVNFRVDKNEIAKLGEKTAHLVVNTPSGKIVNQKGTFNTKDGKEVGYTVESVIDYQGTAKDGTLFIENISPKLTKGLYPVKIYVDGVLVGATTIELKDAFLGL